MNKEITGKIKQHYDLEIVWTEFLKNQNVWVIDKVIIKEVCYI